MNNFVIVTFLKSYTKRIGKCDKKKSRMSNYKRKKNYMSRYLYKYYLILVCLSLWSCSEVNVYTLFVIFDIYNRTSNTGDSLNNLSSPKTHKINRISK